jgi:hypothetical protein
MACGIYEIWCGPYFYQGSSTDIERRLEWHHRNLVRGGHWNRKFLSAFRSYGWTDAGVLVECEEHALSAWEQAYIDTNWGDEKFLNLNRHVAQHYKRRPAMMHRLVLSLYGFVW